MKTVQERIDGRIDKIKAAYKDETIRSFYQSSAISLDENYEYFRLIYCIILT